MRKTTKLYAAAAVILAAVSMTGCAVTDTIDENTKEMGGLVQSARGITGLDDTQQQQQYEDMSSLLPGTGQ